MGLTDEAQGAVEFGRYRLLPHRRELHAMGWPSSLAVALSTCSWC